MDSAQATQKYIRRSARKVRLVANMIRGKKVSEVYNILKYLNHGSTVEVDKVVRSAVANLKSKSKQDDIDNDLLILERIEINQGTYLKRNRPVSRGRGHRIRKPTCHIFVKIIKS